ncbi:hypothetical protein XA68_18014 [Ophiocordyceps unilateralis]|uniref:Uncharacterized protein n=1 Tax=Ophiocordyceps unilateralis TaxID=268505 RepID=A0A2A9PIM8_OPHUN|nr:hypothetical protein XA68_18014 [Ophiocordyceps unilateralis]
MAARSKAAAVAFILARTRGYIAHQPVDQPPLEAHQRSSRQPIFASGTALQLRQGRLKLLDTSPSPCNLFISAHT